MRSSGRRLALVFALLLVAGCASTGKFKEAPAPPSNPSLERLEAALGEAAASGVADLAPDGFRAAQGAAGKAQEALRRGRGEVVEREAARGLARLEQAGQDAARAREVLGDVLAPRERAVRAGAAELFGTAMGELDGRLRDVARLVERGRTEEAKDRRVPLIEGYLRLELDALKRGTDRAAESAIRRAEDAGAKRFAPRTLQLARDELGVALSILEANREDTERANAHAQRAIWLARRATAVTELARDFDRKDYSTEDIVLWHQDQLATVAEPLGGEPLPFDQPDRAVVLGLQARVADTAKSAAEGRAQTARLEAELAALKQRHETDLAAASEARTAAERRDQEDKARFDRVQALFTRKEADVFRQRQNVLIAAHGFWFPSGGSEIDTVNFGLLNKIVRAIREFPGSHIDVMGHTDAAGDADLNRALSQSRAGNVARFLVDVGGVAQERVTARGFGEDRPVASNDTKEGRAANRRVEILIVNE